VPAATAPAPSPRESWLLIFNCQVLGLSNSLSLGSDAIRLEHHDPGNFRKAASEVLERWDSFDRVLIAPQLLSLLPEAQRDDPKVWKVPTIAFNAYHPDICYLQLEGKPLKGPMSDYHSAIAYAAWQLDWSLERTIEAFEARTYEALGYLDRWDGAKRALFDRFAAEGWDIAPHFARWTRSADAFMYSINHVDVHCLRDLAHDILRRAGMPVAQEYIAPHDNLRNGPMYPVYPEIAARLGVRGSMHFKVGGEYRFIRLPQFVQESFETYRRHPEATVNPEHAATVANARTLLEART